MSTHRMNLTTHYPKLFVVGCPRSGTSWVTQLIASHPSVTAVPIETHAYPLIYEPFVRLPSQTFPQRLRSWKGTMRRYGPLPLFFGFTSSDIWRGILRNYQILNKEDSHGLRLLASYDTFKGLVQTEQSRPGSDQQKAEQVISDLFDLFFQQNGKVGHTLLEKTPMHLRYVDRILQRFPEARVVEVIRDGRDVCASYQALAQQYAWADMGLPAVMRQWKSCIEQGDRWRSHTNLADRIHTVRYEALKAEPANQLQQLFNFADLSVTAQQVSEIVQMADIRNVSAKGEGQYVRKGIVGDWQNRLSAKDVETCEAIAGPQLTRLGYS
ncbi:MAG: sulfotransferase [Phormidesmis sp.]